MRGQDLEAGKAVERALEDQMLERDGRVERIADGVCEPAIALETPRKIRRALRVNEQHRTELFRLCPDRMEAGFGEILAQHARSDGGAAQAQLLDCVLELLDRNIRMLQGERGKGGEAVRARSA